MAKGASTEIQLGKLHTMLTGIFTKVLENYMVKLNSVDLSSDLESDLFAAVTAANIEPSPAMLSAISKFLKDNDVTYDSEELDQLSSLEQQLQEKKNKRPNFDNVTDLPLTGTNG